jgi:uncharacterized iron-regulated membrane protein
MNTKILRLFRKIHRTTGALLFIFFFLVSITALLLGWKKNSGGLILPNTSIGSSTNLNEWLPIDSLHKIAVQTLHDKVDSKLSTELDRIDIRNNKGVVKFVFVEGYWEIQVDGANGKILQILHRRSDLIEDLHDGSFLDYYFNTKGEPIKLIYTSIMGIALFVFTITGFWLWYGPIQIRKQKRAVN